MFRILSSSSVKQGQRVTSKAFQHGNPQPQSRLFNKTSSKNAAVDLQEDVPSYTNRRYYNGNNKTSRGGKNNKFGYRERLINNYYVKTRIPEDSPLRNELLAFEEYTSQVSNYDLVSEKASAVPTYWKAINNVMPLYRQLVNSTELTPQRITNLIVFLRSALYMNRYELSNLEKKPDMDSSSSSPETFRFLFSSIREITNDLLDGHFGITAHGLSVLISAYEDMNFKDEAVSIYQIGTTVESLKPLFKDQKVLGRIFPLLVQSGNYTFQQLEAIFNESKLQNHGVHHTLYVGMIHVCLANNKVEEAIEFFQELTEKVYGNVTPGKLPDVVQGSYLTKAHLLFVGQCKDINTADVFFNNARLNEMPYPTPLMMNYIKLYMDNTWEATSDIDKVTKIWLETWANYISKGNTANIISTSLNNSFFKLFFTCYPDYSVTAFNKLQHLIRTYAGLKKIDESFLNILLTKSAVWKNTQITESIMAAYDAYQVSVTNVYYRCAVKAYGSIDVSCDKIREGFERLLMFNEKNGQNYISKADWYCLVSATLDSRFKGDKQRTDLYMKLFKKYSPYFIDVNQYYHFLKNIKMRNTELSHVFSDPDMTFMKSLDVSGLRNLPLKSLKRCPKIPSYV